MKKIGTIGLMLNLALIVLGLILLVFSPFAGLSQLINVLGFLVLGGGIILIVQYFLNRSKGTATMNSIVNAVILLAVGVILLIFSRVMANVLVPLAILFWTFISVLRDSLNAFRLKDTNQNTWWIPLIFAGLYLIFGIIVAVNMFSKGSSISGALSTFMLIYGIVGVLDYFVLNQMTKELND
ncbi:MAG: DUF308 domain-containing protein [Christensenellaceae bacterium]